MDQQPHAPQPPVPPQIPAQPPQPISAEPAAQQPVNPGQATGIISLILAFVGLAPFGLVLSIISTIQSKKAKASPVLGIIGIVINAIAVLVLAFLILVVSISYSGIQQRAKESSLQTTADSVARNAEAYYASYGSYPQTINDFKKKQETNLNSVGLPVTSTPPTDGSSIMYKACGDAGAEVEYFSTTANIPYVMYLGDGSLESCSGKQPINTTT